MKWEKIAIYIQLHVCRFQRSIDLSFPRISHEKLYTFRISISVQGWTVIEHRCRGSCFKKWKYCHNSGLTLGLVPPANHKLSCILIVSPHYPTRASRRQWFGECSSQMHPIRLFCKVNNILRWLTSFTNDALAVIYCFTMYFWTYLTFFFKRNTRINDRNTITSF